MLRASVDVRIVRELGDAAKRDCGVEGPLVKVNNLDRVVESLSQRFGQPLRTVGRNKFATADGSVCCRVSVSNAEAYLRQHAYFNRVVPEDLDLSYYVLWSEYNPLGFIISAGLCGSTPLGGSR